MLCVELKHQNGTFNYYEQLTKIIETLKPKYISVQGEERLIQKMAIELLIEIKKMYPNIELELVTNGNADESMVETVRRLFDKVTISIVGFQSETYRKIMMIDINKTMRVAEELLNNNNHIYICLKYLVSPLNAHESNLFLNWAIRIDAKHR